MAKLTIETLRSVTLFSALDDSELERLAAEFNERTYPPGEAVTTQGEGGQVFFIIDSGQATVTVSGVEVRTMGPGEVFGEASLIDRRPRTATVTAATELCVFTMPIWSFRPFVESHPTVGWKLLESLADRLAAAQAFNESD